MIVYTLSENTRIQKDARITKGTTLKETVQKEMQESGFNPERSFFAVSKRGRIFALNLSASLILEELLGGADTEQLITMLQSIFDVSKKQAEADIAVIIADLITKDIITPSGTV